MKRRTSNVILTTLLLALVAGTTAAAPQPRIRALETTSPNLEVVDALLEGDIETAIVASLVAAGGDSVAVRALLDGAVGEQVTAAPDLNGDELPDVIGIARPQRAAQVTTGAGELLTITARSGLTGASLWSGQVPGVTATTLGSPGGPLVISADAGPGGIVTQYMTAFSRTGAVRWQRIDPGLAGTTAIQWTEYGGRLARASGATAHLVFSIDYSFLLDGVIEPGRVVARVISDADGSVLDEVSKAGQGVPWAWAVPDLDKDGNDDVLLTQAFAFGSRGTAAAMSSDGDELWSTTAPFRSNGFLVLPGDATGDGGGDIAIGADAPTVALVNGSNGTIVWENEGEWPSAIGDINEDDLPDVGVRAVGVPDFRQFETLHAAYDGEGNELYSERFQLPIDTMLGFSASTRTYLVTADVQGDGVTDTFHEYDITYSNNERTHDSGATSGATGKRLWEGRLGILLGDSVKGPGVDLADIRTNSSQIFVEVLRGDTRQSLWRVGLDAPGTLASSTASAADLDGDGVGDVLVTAVTNGENGAVVQHGFVLDGHDGSLAW